MMNELIRRGAYTYYPYDQSIYSSVNIQERKALIDWLYDVREEIGATMIAMDMAVELMDRYFSKFRPSRDKYQIYALTCLMIGQKYEDAEFNNEGITTAELAYFLPSTTQSEIVSVEWKILTALEWKLLFVTTFNCLNYLILEHKITGEVKDLCRDLVSKVLLDTSYKRFAPMSVAYCIVLVASQCYKKDIDISIDEYCLKTDYSPCVDELLACIDRDDSLIEDNPLIVIPKKRDREYLLEREDNKRIKVC
jgi:hypothetical protein